MGLVEFIDRRFYPGFSRNWDDELFRERIIAHLRPDSVVLDLGAGAGIIALMNFRGKAARVCGLDPDPRVTTNPYLDEGRQGMGEAIPFSDESFDLVFADNVLEHLSQPATVFSEVARVLKPGGVFLIKTPNRWHYVPTVARATPHRFHQWINRRRGRASADTFRTRYLANSPTDLQRLAQRSQLVVEDLVIVEGRPEYMRLSAPLYALGLAYERMVNASPYFARLRVVMMATMCKPVE